MRTNRLRIALFGLFFMNATVAVAQTSAAGEAWPSRPIRLVLGHSPGGNADTFARALVRPLAERLGQPIVIDNKPGANQIIAAEIAARAPADGYTIYLASQSSLVLNVGAQKKLPYDPVRDFSPVSLLYTIAAKPWSISSRGACRSCSMAASRRCRESRMAS